MQWYFYKRSLKLKHLEKIGFLKKNYIIFHFLSLFVFIWIQNIGESIPLTRKSMDWFPYDNGLRLESVKKKRFRKKATTKSVASIPVKRVLRKIFHSSCLLGVKKCSFFGKFGMLCFLKTPVLRFALLPCYRCILDASYSPGYAPDYIF